jgi:1-phosphatidylinositol-3-phosphate 5-kinase
LRISIEKDSEFLAYCKVIDYSLLLIIDKARRELKVGIIDYMQQYNLKKVMETRYYIRKKFILDIKK